MKEIEVIQVANCGSNNVFLNSGEKRLDTQRQYEQGHKKSVFFGGGVCHLRAGGYAAPLCPYCACYHQIVRDKQNKNNRKYKRLT